MEYFQSRGRSAGKKSLGNPSRLWSPPQDSGQGLAGTVTRVGGLGGGQCQPGAQAAGRRLGAYLGFELFQKTVWRSAAARLQHRPKSGAQRNSIAQGLVRPGEDEGLLGVRVPAGCLRGAVGTAHSSGPSARQLRLLGRRRPPPRPAPGPAPPRPARSAEAPGLGGWEVEEGRAGSRAGCERPPRLRCCAPRVCSLVGLHAAPWALRGDGSVSPGSAACGRRERAAHAGLRTRGAGPSCAALRCARVLRGARSSTGPAPFPSLARPGLGARVPTLLPPAFPGLRSAAAPHTRGCLFLLGLSMLSLFGRVCHRLDAGNKVRPCVIKCVTCAAGAKGASAHH